MSRSVARAARVAGAAPLLCRVLLAGLLGVAAARAPAADACRAGAILRDCPQCPELVVVPAGAFLMGADAAEHRALGALPMFDAMEAPRHRVRIARPFAIGRYSVTFAEWDACVAGGGCGGYRPDDAGWGRGRQPVINVNFSDAGAYLDWLRRACGRDYRLPSEAEWEYAARGGTSTYYYYGDRPDDARSNFGGHRGRALEVGSFPPNPFGLYDMGGNTAQWVADCHHASLAGAPPDGSAWLTGECRLRNVRGGGWSLAPWTVRSAQRIGDPPQSRNTHLGFRVARDLAAREPCEAAPP